jgi:hypothetical protein
MRIVNNICPQVHLDNNFQEVYDIYTLPHGGGRRGKPCNKNKP